MALVKHVIAVGSPHGDDQVAWRLIERLQARQGINARLVTMSDPLQLHDYVDDCGQLIVVDGCSGSGPPGTVTRLEWPDVRIAERHSHSTHGVGIAESLQLATMLGRLPPKVVVFGVEIAQCLPGSSTSVAVESALSQLEAEVLIEINEVNAETLVTPASSPTYNTSPSR